MLTFRHDTLQHSGGIPALHTCDSQVANRKPVKIAACTLFTLFRIAPVERVAQGATVTAKFCFPSGGGPNCFEINGTRYVFLTRSRSCSFPALCMCAATAVVRPPVSAASQRPPGTTTATAPANDEDLALALHKELNAIPRRARRGVESGVPPTSLDAAARPERARSVDAAGRKRRTSDDGHTSARHHRLKGEGE